MSDRAEDARKGFGVSAGLFVAALVYGCMNQGAFYRSQLFILEGLLFATCVLVVLFGPRPTWKGPLGHLAAAASVVAGATLVTAGLNGQAGRGIPQIVFIAALVATAVVMSSFVQAVRSAITDVVVIVGAAIGLYGWFGVAFRSSPAALQHGDLWRASTTITYANAGACVLAMCALVAIAQLTDGRRASRFTSYACLVGLTATLSRGAFLAFAGGLAFIAWKMGWRRVVTAAWPVLAATTLAGLALAPSVLASAEPRPIVAVFGIVAGLALVFFEPRGRVFAFAAISAAVALATLASDHLIRIAAGRVAFEEGASARIQDWSIAIESARADAVTGHGPSTFFLRYSSNETFDAGLFVHNEYLQVLVEQGLIGFVALAVALVIIGPGVLRVRSADAAWVGPSSAGIAILVHAATDFVWNVPIVPVVAVALVASIPSGRERGARCGDITSV